MFQNSAIIKLISRIVLAAFVYSFVAFEPAYGIVEMNRASAMADAALTKIDRFVLPYNLGRVTI